MATDRKQIKEAIEHAINKARAVAEAAGVQEVDICLEVLHNAYQYDDCKEIVNLLIEYSRAKAVQQMVGMQVKKHVFIRLPGNDVTH